MYEGGQLSRRRGRGTKTAVVSIHVTTKQKKSMKAPARKFRSSITAQLEGVSENSSLTILLQLPADPRVAFRKAPKQP